MWKNQFLRVFFSKHVVTRHPSKLPNITFDSSCQKNLVRLNGCVSDFLITKAAAKAENVFCAGKVVDCPSNSFFKGEKASHDPSDLKIKSRFPFHVLNHFWNPDNIGTCHPIFIQTKWTSMRQGTNRTTILRYLFSDAQLDWMSNGKIDF